MILLHTLGQCLVRTSLGMITPRADVGFALALRMVAERGRRFSRQRLIAYFWPDATPRAASHGLSVALHKLRSRGLPITGNEAGELWIPRESARVDVEQIPDLTPAELATRDLTLLPDYEPHGSAEFRDWFDDWQLQLGTAAARGVSLVLANAEQDEDWPNALIIAEQLLRLDPGSQYGLAVRARAAAALRQPLGVSGTGIAPSSSRLYVHEAMRAHSLAVRQRNRRIPLIGRESEREILLATFEDMRRGRGRYVHVHGAPGIGKTRLASDFLDAARSCNAASLVVTCHAPDAHKPLSTAVAVASRLRRLPGAAGCAPQNVAVLDRLLRHDPSDTTIPAEAAEPDYVLESIRRALIDLTESVVDEQAVALILDNLHWVDPASRDLLQVIAGLTASMPLTLVTTSREPSALASPDVLSVPLRPLNTEDAELYARAVAHGVATEGASEPDDELLRWIVRASEGNPLWIEELVGHSLAIGGRAELPPPLAALLATRIEALSAPARRVLQLVAVLNGTATSDTVEAALGYDPPTLLQAYDELDTASLIDGPDTPTGTIACRHDTIESAALASASPATLQFLHRRAAKLLNPHSTAVAPVAAEMLFDRALHLKESGEATPAIEAALSCIQHLAANGLLSTAKLETERLVRVCGSPTDSIAVLRMQAQLQHLAHEWPILSETVERLRNAELAAGATRAHGHDDIELLELDAAWHQTRDWNAILERAMRCTDAGTPFHRARAAVLALKIATNIGAVDAMNTAYDRLRLLLNDNQVPEFVARAAQMIYHTVCGDIAVAHTIATTILADVRRSPNATERIRHSINCAGVLYRAGDAQFQAVYSSAVEEAVSLGHTVLAGEACQRCFSTLSEIGEIDATRRWIARYEQIRVTETELWQQRPLRLARARLAIAAGDVDAAISALQSGSASLCNDPVPLFRQSALATRLWLELETAAPISAVEHTIRELKPLSDTFRAMGAQDYETILLAAGLTHIGDQDGARCLMKCYTESERRDPFPMRATLLAMLGRHAAAASAT